MTAVDVRRTVEAVWRIESGRLIAVLARTVGDVGLAEELAQDALVAALEQWPRTGVPRNPGAWLTTVAKRRADRRLAAPGTARRPLRGSSRTTSPRSGAPTTRPAPWRSRSTTTCCGSSSSPATRCSARCRASRSPSSSSAASRRKRSPARSSCPSRPWRSASSRAKKTLSAARVPFDVPERAEFPARLGSVLEVVYLIFNEGYSATAGDDWMRPSLCRGGAAARPRARRAHPARARGARPGGADGVPGVAAGSAHDGDRGADPAAGPGPVALGPHPDPPRGRRAAAVGATRTRGAGRTRSRRRSPAATPRRPAPRRPTGTRSWRSTARSPSCSPTRWSSSTAPSRSRWRTGPRPGLEVVDRLVIDGALAGVPPAAVGARRPPDAARTFRGGAAGVRAGGGAHGERSRTGAAAGAGGRVSVIPEIPGRSLGLPESTALRPFAIRSPDVRTGLGPADGWVTLERCGFC